jgi:uncharacterized protein (TIGR03083 family)
MEVAMIRDLIAAHRRELAAVLAGLSAQQWDESTLCDGWAVRHVVAHLTMPYRYSAPRFLLGIARAGGSFQRMSDGVARRDGRLPTATLIAALRDNADSPWKPPGGGFQGALTHDVIHGLDITVPLGIERQIPAETMREVLDSITGPGSLRHFGVSVAGKELRATDMDWSRGSGEPVTGRAQDLALALTGRPVVGCTGLVGSTGR